MNARPKKRKAPIQNILDEFMKTDSPCMNAPVNKYKNIESARTTWVNAIRRSKYPLRIIVAKDENKIYIVKVSPDKRSDYMTKTKHGKRTQEDEHAWYTINAIKAAEDLGYPEEIIDAINKAKTDSEISHIMATARINNLFGKRKKEF